MSMAYTDLEQRRKTQKAYRERNRVRLYEYLLEHPCVDCGESNPIVLEFDHVRGKKEFNVGRAVSGSHRSWNRIYQEILKCEVRCANCHKIKTFNDNPDWFGPVQHLL